MLGNPQGAENYNHFPLGKYKLKSSRYWEHAVYLILELYTLYRPYTLKYSVVIFQTLKPLQSQWPQWPQQPQWSQWPRQPHMIKTFTDPDGLIISSTQLTNTSPFLWNGSPKIQFFTDIWYFFCQRLLRPADVIFFENWWGRQNLAFLRNT